MGCAVACDFYFAGLADGHRFLQEEGDSAETEIAGHDVVIRIGVGAVEDGENRLTLNRLAVLPTAVAVLRRRRMRLYRLRWARPIGGRRVR